MISDPQPLPMSQAIAAPPTPKPPMLPDNAKPPKKARPMTAITKLGNSSRSRGTIANHWLLIAMIRMTTRVRAPKTGRNTRAAARTSTSIGASAFGRMLTWAAFWRAVKLDRPTTRRTTRNVKKEVARRPLEPSPVEKKAVSSVITSATRSPSTRLRTPVGTDSRMVPSSHTLLFSTKRRAIASTTMTVQGTAIVIVP